MCYRVTVFGGDIWKKKDNPTWVKFYVKQRRYEQCSDVKCSSLISSTYDKPEGHIPVSYRSKYLHYTRINQVWPTAVTPPPHPPLIQMR